MGKLYTDEMFAEDGIAFLSSVLIAKGLVAEEELLKYKEQFVEVRVKQIKEILGDASIEDLIKELGKDGNK
jgi:TPP-dependent pyruvate/acetoin dehydrogenase alpha subunit